METAKEFLLNAEIAFTNKQYNESLGWFKKVLNEEPSNVYALSKAGAICVPLGLFEEALLYFGRAKELDPNNGDNVFNYANACFFNKDNVTAFREYVEAEKIGCSEDVIPRLYYQMALLCSMRQDIKSALVYFDKCEKSDREGSIVLTPDFISEKMKIYMVLEDYSNAEKCARQLIAANPADFRSYMICFSIIMAKNDYKSAEKILNDADEYAKLNLNDKQTLLLQYSALYAAMGDDDTENKRKYYNKATELLKEQQKKSGLSSEQKVNILMTLSEICMKSESYTDALECLDNILKGSNKSNIVQKDISSGEVLELTPDEIERMIEQDMMIIQNQIDNGEMDSEMGAYAEVDYDENGALVRFYDDSVFASLNMITQDKRSVNTEQNDDVAEKYEVPLEIREKIYFLYLSCYLAMDDYKNADIYATVLKHSSNKYYNYYGLYSTAMLYRKVNGDTETARHKYTEAIAFFRNKSFADHSDTLAVIFRARLYAEEGHYEKARELGHLLAEADKESIYSYVEQCRK